MERIDGAEPPTDEVVIKVDFRPDTEIDVQDLEPGEESTVIEVGAKIFKGGLGIVRSSRVGPVSIIPEELKRPRRWYHPDNDVS